MDQSNTFRTQTSYSITPGSNFEVHEKSSCLNSTIKLVIKSWLAPHHVGTNKSFLQKIMPLCAPLLDHITRAKRS